MSERAKWIIALVLIAAAGWSVYRSEQATNVAGDAGDDATAASRVADRTRENADDIAKLTERLRRQAKLDRRSFERLLELLNGLGIDTSSVEVPPVAPDTPGGNGAQPAPDAVSPDTSNGGSSSTGSSSSGSSGGGVKRGSPRRDWSLTHAKVASEEDREVIRHLLRDGGNGVPLTAAGPLIRILTDSKALAQYAKERGE